MNNMVARVLTSLLLGVLMMGSAAHAQQSQRVIKANIPFDFVVGSRIFPAGRYLLVRIEPSLLELRDSDGHVLANVLTQSVLTLTSPASPKLRFDAEGGRHVLTQVWQENESIGQQIPQSKSVTRAVRKGSGHVQTAEVGNPR
jgi:hypothetical protein